MTGNKGAAPIGSCRVPSQEVAPGQVPHAPLRPPEAAHPPLSSLGQGQLNESPGPTVWPTTPISDTPGGLGWACTLPDPLPSPGCPVKATSGVRGGEGPVGGKGLSETGFHQREQGIPGGDTAPPLPPRLAGTVNPSQRQARVEGARPCPPPRLTFLVPGPPAMRDIPVSEEERPGCPPRPSCCGDIASMKKICKPIPSPGQGGCAARSAQAGRRGTGAVAGGAPPVGAMDRGPSRARRARRARRTQLGLQALPAAARPSVSASPAPPLRARPAPAALPEPPVRAAASSRHLALAAGATNLAGRLGSSLVRSPRCRAPRTAASGRSPARLSACSLPPASFPAQLQRGSRSDRGSLGGVAGTTCLASLSRGTAEGTPHTPPRPRPGDRVGKNWKPPWHRPTSGAISNAC